MEGILLCIGIKTMLSGKRKKLFFFFLFISVLPDNTVAAFDFSWFVSFLIFRYEMIPLFLNKDN